MTEVFRAAWEDRDVAYLAAVYDGDDNISEYPMPLTVEANAERWIAASPPAFCNTNASELLARILPGFDQETRDFYRWQVSYANAELREIIATRLGIDVGRIEAIEPIERGQSGRITKLEIKGEQRVLVIGKELQIRRTLSRSHLYSSAFVVSAERDASEDHPHTFTLTGAGWGHGVGLCQIGAAVMAERGYTHDAILAHYFRGATLHALY
jgi:peptidoglycan hydrolase-like amidase